MVEFLAEGIVFAVADDAGSSADLVAGVAGSTGPVGDVVLAERVDGDAFVVGAEVVPTGTGCADVPLVFEAVGVPSAAVGGSSCAGAGRCG